MQVGSASTVGRRSSVRTLTVTRVRSSDSPLPRDQQRSQTTGSTSITHGGASVTIARQTALAVPETTFRAASPTPATTPQQGRQDLGKDASPRSTTERNGTWNARYLCRMCLVREWGRSPHEIDQWLMLYHPGSRGAANSYQLWQSSSSWSGWHGQWDRSSQDSRWNYDSGRWP